MFNKLKIVSGILALTLLLCGCGVGTIDKSDNINSNVDASIEDAVVIELKGDKVVLDGAVIEEFDYTWHSDPSKAEEWYEGVKPETDSKAYVAHDIWYYPTLNEDGFTKVEYDGEIEWAYNYAKEGLTDFIYATLPVQGTNVPVEMMHTAKEAYVNPVLHIIEPGTYILRGEWNGQIMIDLGEKDATFVDENSKVKLIFDGVDVNCTVAPAFIAYSAFECDNGWEERADYSCNVNTEDAGISIEIADNSINNFSGTNIYRMLKPQYKKEGSVVQKKLRKIDGAFYSYVTMNISGQEKETGILNITSGFEGLDDELHLTINSGNINIYSQNDGINVNEDNVSVFTMNDGTLHIFAGLGVEGDCIDSNGYIVVNGGTIAGGTPSGSDELLDSDCGNTINGGSVITIGSSKGFGMPGGEAGKEPPMGFDGERPKDFDRESPKDFNGEFPADFDREPPKNFD